MAGGPGHSVPFVGLTGGMGAGKSEALAALERLGAETLSTDAVVHELLESAEVRDLLVRRFGERVAPGGEVDRAVIAALVFEQAGEREWLESVLWPRVGARVAAWREQVARHEPPPAAAVVEVPLLFESGMEAVFDRTIAVVADDGLRARRTAARGHGGLERRDARQLAQDEKAARADFVVRNDRGIPELEEELARVLAKLRA